MSTQIDNKNICSLIAIGDSRAFDKFVEQFYPGLYSYACQFMRDNMDAEELVLDVFVSIWQRRTEIQKISNIKAYLYKSTKNRVIDFIRANKNTINISLDDVFDNAKIKITNTPENDLISKEEIDRINDAIEQLPKRCKEVIYLVKNERLCYKEVAEIMSISVKTVENQMTLALSKLADNLGIDRNNKKKRDQILYMLLI